MSSPRKYSSPYLTGLPGLPSSSASSSAIKPKKKSKNSVTKLSESAAAVKKIQDGIWQTAKDTLKRANGENQALSRQETSFDDASSCGGIVVEQFLDEMKETSHESESQDTEEKHETEEHENDIADESKEIVETFSLVVSKDLILSRHGSDMGRGSTIEGKNKSLNQKEDETETPQQEHSSTHSVSETLLKSILKKSSMYASKSKKESSFSSGHSKRSSKGTSKGKYGRPVRENKDAPSVLGRVVVTKLKGAQGSASNLEVRNRLNNNKNAGKSPRTKSTVEGGGKSGDEKEKEKVSQQVSRSLPMSQKSVRFATRVDVHVVPYEPRAGSRACDWQRNMLEQRVQTFRQLMKEVGSSEDIDLFGNSMLFPGYTSYHVPNPNFALRGQHNAGTPPGSGFVGMSGIGRPRNNLCNSNNKFNNY